VTRLAHLTDLHLDGSIKRRDKLRAGLAHANAWMADHLVLTGDLTSMGRDREYEELVGILSEEWPRSSTIVAGNHDGGMAQFHKFFLAPVTIDFGDVVVMGLDTQYPGRALAFWALGRVNDRELEALENLAFHASAEKPLVVAMHHVPEAVSPLGLFDGMLGASRVRRALARPHVSALCGHDHRIIDFGSVHTAASVAHHPDPLRVYDVTTEYGFTPIYQSHRH